MNVLFVILSLSIVAIIGFMVIGWAFGILDFKKLSGPFAKQSISDMEVDSVIFSKLPESEKVTESRVVSYVHRKADDQLKDKGKVFYDMGVKYDIDPAFGVGVSRKETRLGKSTCGGISNSCNNFFCVSYAAVKFTGLSTGTCGGDRWAGFDTPEDGIEAFFKYIRVMYVDRKTPQDTISEIGCGPGSGHTSHCYCACEGEGCTTVYCPSWVEGSDSVLAYTNEVRDYETV